LLSQEEQPVFLDMPPNIISYPFPYTGFMRVDGPDELSANIVLGLIASDSLYDQHDPAIPPLTGAAMARLGAARLPGRPSARPPRRADRPIVAPEGLTSVRLLSAIAPTNTALWTVKNQPSWFIYDNGDDVFLVASQQQPLFKIDYVFRATAEPPGLPAGPMY